MINQQPKVLITEHQIQPIITSYEGLSQAMSKILSTNIYFSISRYSDSLMIIINQTGRMGSLYSGKYIGQCLPQLQQQDQQSPNQQYKISQTQHMITQKLYEIKCLFGSTQIQFYQLLMRKILATIFEQTKIDQSTKVILNVSLPVKCNFWEENQHTYYQSIVDTLSKAVREVS